MSKSNILPVEKTVNDIVNDVLSSGGASYMRKYTNKSTNRAVQTRRYKYWILYPTMRFDKMDYPLMESLINERILPLGYIASIRTGLLKWYDSVVTNLYIKPH